MRTIIPAKLEQGRVREGSYGTTACDGLVGAFFVTGPTGRLLKILSSGVDQESGWEHVSISLDNRPPNWAEMSFVKDLFWAEHECVVQFHPPRSEYVNFHPHCLHLWRPIAVEIPRPPSILVGPEQ